VQWVQRHQPEARGKRQRRGAVAASHAPGHGIGVADGTLHAAVDVQAGAHQHARHEQVAEETRLAVGDGALAGRHRQRRLLVGREAGEGAAHALVIPERARLALRGEQAVEVGRVGDLAGVAHARPEA
jgi:hypothetical protein